MGGVWCKADKGHTRSYATRGPFTTTLSRWTDHVRQAYRKPKTHTRPTRPPQKPIRSNERLTISHPQLKESSSDGWRTATLMVPSQELAPVPPPRKKRKRNKDLTRTAFSMDNLNRVESLNQSTISLPEKYHSESGLDSRSSSSTIVVTPVLETRLEHQAGVDGNEADNKENMKVKIESKIVEEDVDEVEPDDVAEEIIPIEKETLFSSRTLLHSNLGYIDKLSAISEVSAESGFDDRTDVKCSDRSESVTSCESVTVSPDSGLTILAHIQNINNVSHLNHANKEVRDKTALSKKEWLQNILQEDPEPYFISRETHEESRRSSDSLVGAKVVDLYGQPNSLPTDQIHAMDRDAEETPMVNNSVSKTPPPTPETRTNPSPTPETASANHSVLLELLQKNNAEEESPLNAAHNPFVFKEESIFLKNTKTNIIYKSLSSDNLTDDYDISYEGLRGDSTDNDSLTKPKKEGLSPLSARQRRVTLGSTNPFNNLTSMTQLSDYFLETPKLVESDAGLNSLSEDKKSNVVSSFEFKEIKSHNYITALKNLQLNGSQTTNVNTIMVNGIEKDPVDSTADVNEESKGNKEEYKGNGKESVATKESLPSSRRSSITDSLHEFELSIYDMLKESKKYRDSSDEDDSLKITKTEKRQ